mmetsp:Transcript_31181/g.27569  ORF Transcript_31181/g.27569 Transcript_31181/m.27569 type:complete len:118 (+) Transcript_31181:170-523(+)
MLSEGVEESLYNHDYSNLLKFVRPLNNGKKGNINLEGTVRKKLLRSDKNIHKASFSTMFKRNKSEREIRDIIKLKMNESERRQSNNVNFHQKEAMKFEVAKQYTRLLRTRVVRTHNL